MGWISRAEALDTFVMGQAASHPQPGSFPYAYGGSIRSALLSAAFMALFVSGLFLWLHPGEGAILILHLFGGIAFTATLIPWLFAHVPQGLARSQRHSFTVLAWLLLAAYVLVLGGGLIMAVPAILWLFGPVWFLPRDVSAVLSWLHFWGSWLAVVGLLAHLTLRHWQWVKP